MRNQTRALMRAVGCLWIVVTTAVVAQPRAVPAQADVGGAVRYEVQPSDVLQVSVWREPELTQQVIVRPDGAFSFPLVGEVNAVGKTVEELRKEIVQALTRIIPDVVVTVAVVEIKGNKVYVIGQVNKPGEFIMNPSVDVMQALSMAGGMTPFAQVGDIVVLRRTPTGKQSLPFRYNDVVKGRRMDQNIDLQAGDVVVVP